MKRLSREPSPLQRCRARLTAIALAALGVAGCAADVPPPDPTPTPTPTPTHSVEGYVFYDENGNLTPDANELTRVPGVDVHIGSNTGRSEARTGKVVVDGVPDGQRTVEADHLPPYYVQKAVVSTTVPTNAPLSVPLSLPIGDNRPNVYMAFGDSITEGDGASDGMGYRKKLQKRLIAYFGVATVANEGASGTRTGRALERIGDALEAERPAYTLILYGTNDWNDAACKYDDGCPTIDNLTAVVRAVRAAGSLPVLATILPANPAYVVQCPPGRNVWVEKTNKTLRSMAQREGALLVDLYAAFMAKSDLVALYYDHVHPNDTGYDIIATELAGAIAGDDTLATSPASDQPANPDSAAAIEAPVALPDTVATQEDHQGQAGEP